MTDKKEGFTYNHNEGVWQRDPKSKVTETKKKTTAGKAKKKS